VKPRRANLPAAGADRGGRQDEPSTAGEQDLTVPLVALADRLSDVLQPVRPSAAFVQSLGRELVQDAASRVETWKRRRRSVATVAAVAGAVLSVASLVGAVVYLTSRSRRRADAEPGEQGS
jgi:hypothetical protein